MGTETNGQPVNEASKKGMYQVFDLNQRGKDGRKHDVITKFYENGEHEAEVQTYELFADKPVAMPMEHAMRFLIDPAFKVVAPSGKRVPYVPKQDISKPITVLGEDEIVVKYEELSRDALFRRAKVLPGSEDIKENTPTKEMADFLTSWRKRMRGMSPGERELAGMMAQGELAGGMDQGMLKTMFPDRKAA